MTARAGPDTPDHPELIVPAPRRRLPDGVPSEAASARFRERLRTEVADLRTRLDETAMRAEAHRLLGDDAAAAEVLREQARLADQLAATLDRALGEALVEREAEAVLAAVPTERTVPAMAEDAAEPRTRRLVGVGAGAIAAVFALVAGAVVGTASLRGPDAPLSLEVTGIGGSSSDVAPTDETSRSDEPSPPADGVALGDVAGPASTPSSPAQAGPTAPGVGAGPSAAEGANDDAAAGPGRPVAPPTGTEDPTEEPAGPTLAEVIEQIVEGLQDPEGVGGDPDDEDEDGEESDQGTPPVGPGDDDPEDAVDPDDLPSDGPSDAAPVDGPGGLFDGGFDPDRPGQ